jgi:hypothetical protein
MEPDMLERLADREDAVSAASAGDRKARRWVIRVIAVMLIVQAVVLMYVSGATGLAFNWQRELADPDLSPRALDTLLLLGVLLPVAVFEVMTAIGIWLGRGSAWLNALILQGLLLIYCLSLYIDGRSRPFVYVLMLLCILTVLYLNANDVRLTFQSRRRTPGTSRP